MIKMRIKKSMRNARKGQAALEFMLTYGWALLLLTTLIAGLVYIMPHPRSLAANKCIFNSAIPCLGAQLMDQNLTVVLRNGLGQSIYNISAYQTMPKNMICDVSSTTLRSEALLTVTCDNNVAGGMNVSEDTRIRIEFTYQKIKGGFNQIVVGEIYAKYIDS
jgi:hypothetical protein